MKYYDFYVDLILVIRYSGRWSNGRTSMRTVKVSPKFQVVIPKEVRERLKLKPGQELVIYEIEGQIRLEPPSKIRNLRGLARGIRWEDADRDHAERL